MTSRPRYCARPCFALGRLTVLRDGRITYRIKYAGRGGTHRVMTPVELDAAALRAEMAEALEATYPEFEFLQWPIRAEASARASGRLVS